MLHLASTVKTCKINGPLINIDILHNVVTYTDLSTILQLTKTCHEFNVECAQDLLKHWVCLEEEHLVESFISFLTASGRPAYARRRLPFFTNLDLKLGPSPSEGIKFALAELFVCVLPLATRFTHLALHHSDALLAPDSPLLNAVADLTTLKHLVLYKYGAHCAGMLYALQSQLVTIKLIRGQAAERRMIAYPLDDPLQYPIHDPLHLLYRSQGTLQGMAVDLPITLRQGFYYPNVVELNIACADYLPTTHTYIRAFPNLVKFAINFGGNMFSQARAPTSLACRQGNITEQHDLGTWKSLRHVEGSIQDIFLLGLTCAIPELNITLSELVNVDEDLDLNVREADAFRQVLAYARPTELTLRILDSYWIESEHGFDLLSQTPQLVSLSSLHVHVQVSRPTGVYPELGDCDALDYLQDIIPQIKPVHLSVTLDWTEWVLEALEEEARSGEAGLDRERQSSLLKGALETVDIEHLTRQFLHADSQSVRLSFVGPYGWRREMTCSDEHPEEVAVTTAMA